MEHDPQQDAPLARGSLAGSEEQLVRRAGATGGSNKRALKVAGLTTLACLLLASQVFMVYTMFGQTQKIHKLQKNSESLQLQMKRPAQGRFPMKMSLPSVPLLMKLADDTDTTSKEEEQHKEEVNMETQLRGFLQGSELPSFSGSFLDNLQSMKMKMNESEWKSLESWMHNWLIFQMAQHQPPPTAQPGLIQTKCQLESAPQSRKFGTYTPQCDEQGRYSPMQCWHATGFCWCVDESGTPIQGTRMRGRPDCQRGRIYNVRSRALVPPQLSQKMEN